MPLLVDAYNVLHQTGVLPPVLAGLDVRELADLMAESRWAGEPVVLVCDGAPPDEPGRPTTRISSAAGQVTILYAGAGRTADDVIMARVAASSAPRRLTVVTSDREIRQAARKRRCPLMTSPELLERLAEDARAAGWMPPPAEGEPPTPAAPSVPGRVTPIEMPPPEQPVDVSGLEGLLAEAEALVDAESRRRQADAARAAAARREEEAARAEAERRATSAREARRARDDEEAARLAALEDAVRREVAREAEAEARLRRLSEQQEGALGEPPAPSGEPPLPDDLLAEAERLARELGAGPVDDGDLHRFREGD